MKYIFYTIFLLSLGSCSKLSNCEPVAAKCLEQPPTNEACLAQFERWFFNSNTNSCELKSYSGCKEYGFETESECNECKCKD